MFVHGVHAVNVNTLTGLLAKEFCAIGNRFV
ncbi:hypothetical protein J2W55_004567 [Mucilaginibacter pocheonensis]|uniref:Uncharacterized protein n=1 Tax=Mucilaginibacter pocheonensis TaxID=398050 RepID=A0ABU1TH21_9SPHI|nr:hypothetical protein [Mucilaginibacter pocheonensis]